jgi:hypothetical protein
MWISNFLLTGQVAASASALIVLASLLIRWLVVPPLERKIDEKTSQIQINSNGGKSLPDVAIMLGRISEKIDVMDRRLGAVETKICTEKKDT